MMPDLNIFTGVYFMKRLFPEMTNCLNGGFIFCILAYWVLAFVLFPFLLPVLAYGSWDDMRIVPWFEFAYHLINGLVLAQILKEALSDGILEIQIVKKNFFGTVFAAFGAMILYVLAVAQPLCYFLDIPYLVDVFPISEMGIAVTPGLMVMHIPVPAILCLSLATPFALAGMFYATGFAPVCCRIKWLGYLTVAVLLLLPAGFDILWRGDAHFVLLEYALQLPVHLIACWSYQKTDNIWTPIGSLALFNLATSLLCVPL